jgi:hypothetical protein
MNGTTKVKYPLGPCEMGLGDLTPEQERQLEVIKREGKKVITKAKEKV